MVSVLCYQNPDNEMCSSESHDVGVDDVPKRIQRSKTMSLEMFKISDKASVFASFL